MIPCICIDAKNKPSEILIQNWISEGMKYHIIHVFKQMNKEQLGIKGVLLREVNTKSEKYNCYRLDRFAFTEKSIEDLIELMNICTGLDEVNIKQLIEESDLQLIENE